MPWVRQYLRTPLVLGTYVRLSRRPSPTYSSLTTWSGCSASRRIHTGWRGGKTLRSVICASDVWWAFQVVESLQGGDPPVVIE